MICLKGREFPDLPATMCASCTFGVVVLRDAPPEDEGDAVVLTMHNFCRAIQIAGSSGTAEFVGPVVACAAYESDPRKE